MCMCVIIFREDILATLSSSGVVIARTLENQKLCVCVSGGGG